MTFTYKQRAAIIVSGLAMSLNGAHNNTASVETANLSEQNAAKFQHLQAWQKQIDEADAFVHNRKTQLHDALDKLIAEMDETVKNLMKTDPIIQQEILDAAIAAEAAAETANTTALHDNAVHIEHKQEEQKL